MRPHLLISLTSLMISQTLTFGCGIQMSSDRLFEAIELRNHSILRNFNDLQQFVNTPDNQGRYPLHLASWKGDDEMVQLLLDNGADVNLTNEGGSALDRALSAGYGDVAKLLLEAGAQVSNEVNITGHSLVHYIRQGDLELVELLLQQGADVNYETSVVLPLSAWVYQYTCSRNTYYLHGADGYPVYYEATCSTGGLPANRRRSLPAISRSDRITRDLPANSRSGAFNAGVLTVAINSNVSDNIKGEMIHLLLRYNAQPIKYNVDVEISLGMDAESAVYTYSDATKIIELSRNSESLRDLEELGILDDITARP